MVTRAQALQGAKLSEVSTKTPEMATHTLQACATAPNMVLSFMTQVWNSEDHTISHDEPVFIPSDSFLSSSAALKGNPRVLIKGFGYVSSICEHFA